MPRPKMLRPLPDSGETAHDRFKRFAKAVLAVPKTEITASERKIEELQAEKTKIESQIEFLERELEKRKSARR